MPMGMKQGSDKAQTGPGVNTSSLKAPQKKAGSGLPSYGSDGQNATPGNRNKR